jgi:hypothetical protein
MWTRTSSTATSTRRRPRKTLDRTVLDCLWREYTCAAVRFALQHEVLIVYNSGLSVEFCLVVPSVVQRLVTTV